MASISTLQSGSRKGTRTLQFVRPRDGKRATIYLGRMPMKVAQTLRVRVEEIIDAMLANTTPSPETSVWIAGVSPQLREKLEKHGLVGASRSSKQLTLQQLVDKFIATQVVQPATLAVYGQATSSLIGHCGGTRLIDAITLVELEQWTKALRSGGLAPATVAKRVNVIKSLFNKAVDWGFVQKSPAASLKRGSQRNPKRMAYVSVAQVEKVIGVCRDPMTKAVLGLARYAGLRIPSEVSPLTKGSVDLRRLVISVYSPKTNSTRLVPISPALEPLLAPLVTGDPADPLFASVHSNSNLATEVRRAIERAGMQPWPKTFQNLRHSCTQDLCEKLPAHAAASMMGHSVTVAAKHYLSVTDDHFRKISRPEGHDGSGATQNATLNTSVDAGTHGNPQRQIPEESELVGSCASGEGWGMGGEGFEQPQDSTGQTGTSRSCNAKCNVDRPDPAIDGRESPSELKVLLDVWNSLSPELQIQFERLIRGGMG